MLTATTTKKARELEEILNLQELNLVQNISPMEMQTQGFVTMHHTLKILQQMHDLAPSIIIKDDEQVVAYALTMLRECRSLVAGLEPMFHMFEPLRWKDKPLNNYSFYVMGQICIDKKYRGKGLFDLLYQKHKETYQSQFDFIVTEVATRNNRSLRAHERVGFERIHTYRDELDEWVVVV